MHLKHVPRSIAAMLALAVASGTALTACSGSGSTSAHVAQCVNQHQGAGAYRAVRDELTDNPPWQPDDPNSSNEMYTGGSSRVADYYDSDYSGAPAHTSGGGKVYLDTCTQPASEDRKPASYPTISYTCWYQARTPGVHNIYDDWFLGCTVDFVAGYDPNVNSSVIGAHKGKPVDGATCSGSPMSVGDTISIIGSPDTSVADMNAIWNGNKVVGWMYKGDNNQRFVQMNYSNSAGVSVGASWGFASGAVSSPGGYSEIHKWNGSLPPGSRLKKCFTSGAMLA